MYVTLALDGIVIVGPAEEEVLWGKELCGKSLEFLCLVVRGLEAGELGERACEEGERQRLKSCPP